MGHSEKVMGTTS